MHIVMMGVQGSGKGTQSKQLSQYLNHPHISVGDLFRDHISRKTELGKKAKEFIDKGELVPDAIVINMVKKRLEKPDAKNGFILDGFPRNGVQLASLEYLKPVDRAILLQLDNKTAIFRLTQRIECPRCKIIYGTNRTPKIPDICDECGKPLVRRSDDQDQDAIKKRIALYYKEIEVLVKYYEWKGVLKRIDSARSVDEVFKELKNSLK